MRKLKFDKNFQPLPCEADDELYQNGIFQFNITKLLAFIKDSKDKFQVEELEVKAARTFPPSNLNESTIKMANPLVPIILAEISPGRFNVIDGNHRLEKAYSDGMNKVFVYRILAEQHIMFLTSTNAYKEYMKYWNSKLKAQER